MNPNSTAQNLLDQYTSKIKVDPRVFSQDIMSQDSFYSPFKAWGQNYINDYMLPEFLRYQYNPAMQTMGKQLADMNQGIQGTSNWRSAQSARDLSGAADEAMRKQEQLTTGFNDQSMQLMDQLQQAWSDPLYKSRMENFYNAPWRNMNLGGDVQAQLTPTDPRLVGFQPNGANGLGNNQPVSYTNAPMTPFQGNQGLTGQYFGNQGGIQRNLMSGNQRSLQPINAGSNNQAINRSRPIAQPIATDVGGNPINLLSQYLMKPQVSNSNVYNLLRRF